MADEDTLRSFLVRLGWQVDEPGMKRFTDQLETVTKRVVLLGASIELAAAAVIKGVDMMASKMEALYYTSQRTKQSTANILDFKYALEQVGGSAEEAGALLDKFTEARFDPQFEMAMNVLGVNIRKGGQFGAGAWRDVGDAMAEAGKKFKEFESMGLQGGMLAGQYAQQAGISRKQITDLERFADMWPELKRKREDMQRAAGVDTQKLTEKSMQWENKLKDVGTVFDLLKMKVEENLLRALGPRLDEFRDKLIKNLPHIADQIEHIIEMLLNGALWLLPKLEAMAKWFVELNNDTGGWLLNIVALTWALKFLGVTSAISTLIGAFGLLGPAVALALGPVGEFVIVLGAAYAAGMGVARMINKIIEWFTGVKGATLGTWIGGLVNAGADEAITKQELLPGQKTATSGQIGGGPLKMRPRITHSVADIPGMVTVVGDVRDKLAIMAADEEKYGLPAGLLDRMWGEESGRGKHLVSPKGALGDFQFMPDTAKAYGLTDPMDFRTSADAAAHYMADLMHQFQGNLPLALAAYNAGPGSVAAGRFPAETRGYVSDIMAGRGRAGGGQLAGDISLNTTVNVTGSGVDPSSISNAVNAGLQRNIIPQLYTSMRYAIPGGG